MTEFKVGDKVRLSTGVEGKVVQIIPNKEDCIIGFPDVDGKFIHLSSLRAIDIELELVEPALPEEPPVGSVIRVRDAVMERVMRVKGWHETGVGGGVTWNELLQRYGTEFTILEDRNKTIREVLDSFDPKYFEEVHEVIAEKFGVSLDG